MSKILKVNGEIVHQVNNKYVSKVNDEFVQCGSFSYQKGEIIEFDFNGDGEKERYKVLSCTKTLTQVICKLMCMYDWTSSSYYNLNEPSYDDFDGISGLKFQDSLVDTQLTLFYSRLVYKVRDSLIPQNKEQQMWQYTYLGNTKGEVEEGAIYGTINYNDSDYYKLTKMDGVVDLGIRSVYVPSIEDVVEYLGIESSEDEISYSDVYEMFWDSQEQGNINDSIWLSDASFRGTLEDNLNKNAMFFANRQYGNLANYHYRNTFAVRPVFTIDMFKYTESINRR